MINVAVCGANGKMGQEVVRAVNSAEDMTLVAKIDIFNDIGVFFQKATLSQILFGIGLDNAEAFVGMYAHNYIATYLMETGVIGYTIITTFLLRVLYEAPKTIYILLPFSILVL